MLSYSCKGILHFESLVLVQNHLISSVKVNSYVAFKMTASPIWPSTIVDINTPSVYSKRQQERPLKPKQSSYCPEGRVHVLMGTVNTDFRKRWPHFLQDEEESPFPLHATLLIIGLKRWWLPGMGCSVIQSTECYLPCTSPCTSPWEDKCMVAKSSQLDFGS